MVLANLKTGHITARISKFIGLLGLAAMATACSTNDNLQARQGKSWGAPSYAIPAQASKGRAQAQGSHQTDWQATARRNSQTTSSEGHQKIGRPYTISGRTYVPARDDNYDRTGLGSWYGPNFHGKKTANGETFNQNAMTAAHPTLPLPSVVRVTNLDNGKKILVRVNDRGPFVDDRLIDLSKQAATELGYKGKGVAKVRVQYIGPAPAKANSLPVVRAAASSRAKPVATPAPQQRQQVKSQDPNVWPDDPKDKYRVALSKPRTSVSGWFVQAAAYSSRDKAQSIANSMGISGNPMVQEAWVANRTIYRVLVGPYASRPQAETQRAEVVAAGFGKARITEQN